MPKFLRDAPEMESACRDVIGVFRGRVKGRMPSIQLCDPGEPLDGYYKSGKVYLNPAKGSVLTWPFALAHELFHWEMRKVSDDHLRESPLGAYRPRFVREWDGEPFWIEEFIADRAAKSLSESLGFDGCGPYLVALEEDLVETRLRELTQALARFAEELPDVFEHDDEARHAGTLWVERVLPLMEAISLVELMCIRLSAPYIKNPDDLWPIDRPGPSVVLAKAQSMDVEDALTMAVRNHQPGIFEDPKMIVLDEWPGWDLGWGINRMRDHRFLLQKTASCLRDDLDRYQTWLNGAIEELF